MEQSERSKLRNVLREKNGLRLGEILIAEGLATQAQIDEALECQRLHGGRLEAHLLRLGYVNEGGLVRALCRQQGAPGVTLSGLDISPDVLDIVPAGFAYRKLVLPFEHHPESNIVKIGCENPQDEHLYEELDALVGDKSIRLHIAVSSALKSAIIHAYRQALVKQDDETEYEDLQEDDRYRPPIAAAEYRVLILNEGGTEIPELERQLQVLNFGVGAAVSVDDFADRYRRTLPEAVIIVTDGGCSSIIELMDSIQARQIPTEEIPVWVLANNISHDEQLLLLRLGIDDVMPYTEGFDLLVLKLGRVRAVYVAQKQQRLHVIQGLGTHGSLEHINVIDLLQAMGPSEKTARISISANAKQLTIFLDRGRIMYAECDGVTGADAVYKGIPWSRGIWSVDPISQDSLPAANIVVGNDAILLEGCRRMDEGSAVRSNEIIDLEEQF
jgi:hypothetical protein